MVVELDNAKRHDPKMQANQQLGWVRVDDSVYAFSRTAGKWGRLKLVGNDGENILNMRSRNIVVQSGDQVSVFQLKTGTWKTIDLE